MLRETAAQNLQENWRRKDKVACRRVTEKTGWKRRHLGDNQEQDSPSIHRPTQNREKLREKSTHEEASYRTNLLARDMVFHFMGQHLSVGLQGVDLQRHLEVTVEARQLHGAREQEGCPSLKKGLTPGRQNLRGQHLLLRAHQVQEVVAPFICSTGTIQCSMSAACLRTIHLQHRDNTVSPVTVQHVSILPTYHVHSLQFLFSPFDTFLK
jgi:hypothetical protein